MKFFSPNVHHHKYSQHKAASNLVVNKSLSTEIAVVYLNQYSGMLVLAVTKKSKQMLFCVINCQLGYFL